MKRLGRLTASALAALVLLSACSSSGGKDGKYTFDGSLTPPKVIAVSDRKPAENFSGSLLSGKGEYDLDKDAAGKVTVVNFWGAWCGPCQLETPQFQAVYQKYRSKGVAFVGIDIKEASRGLPRAFVQKYKITYPIVYDDEGSTAVTLGNIPTQAAPYTVVLDKEHRVAAVYLERVEQSDLTKVIAELVAEK